MIKRLVGWFKVRFIFTEEQLVDAVDLIDRADPSKLEESVWKKAKEARLYLIRELVRRGNIDFIV